MATLHIQASLLTLRWLILLGLALSVRSACVGDQACYPSPTDLAKVPGSTLSVNSTCGDPPEGFCTQTGCNMICNASSSAERHPKEYLFDAYDLSTFWKSKNFEEPVFIQLDIGQRIILHQIVVTFQFELPEGVYFLRSQDSGSTYYILAYYARECLRTFNLQESTDYDGTKVLCFRIDPELVTKQITYAPRRDENIARQVLSGGAVRDYFITTNIRVALHQYYKPADFNRNTADQRKFYFALTDLDIQGSCFCNGMAEQCDPVAYGKCMCQKNTMGDNCERCLPLYNNRSWEFGKTCQVCNCNNHSASCVFSTAKQMGVCDSCVHNTSGDQCETCRAGFYINANVALTHPAVCLDCGCNVAGVLSGSAICDPVSSACFCKANVTGTKCDVCKDEYFGLANSEPYGCKDCACHLSGTLGGSRVCNKVTGQCPCLPGFIGRDCSRCQDGSVGNTAVRPSVCSPCYCDPSGSLNTTCSVEGICFCKPEFFGPKCQFVRQGFFAGSLQQFLFDAWPPVISSQVAYYSNYTAVSSPGGQVVHYNGYSLYLDSLGGTATSITFLVRLQSTTVYEFILRYLTSFSFSNVTMTIRRQSSFQPYQCSSGSTPIQVDQDVPTSFQTDLQPVNDSASFGMACLSAGNYSVTVVFAHNSAGQTSRVAEILVTSLLAMPSYNSAALYLVGNATLQSQIRYYYNLAWGQASWALYSAQGARYLAHVLGPLFSAGLTCQCNPTGSVATATCAFYGGQCQCHPNVIDRSCGRCLPTFFNFTSGQGCTACNCHPSGSANNTCDTVTGQCSCRSNVIGRQCNQCIPNYFGVSSGTGCQACSCSSDYSTSPQCLDNGACICKPGIGGFKCSQCLPGFYGLTNSGCQDCQCNTIGTSQNSCDNVTGICQCKENVRGPKCSLCKIGYFGFSSLFPNACLRCQCSGKTNECTHTTGLSIANTTTMFGTSENNVNVQGWTGVNSNGDKAGAIEWDWEPRYSLTRGYAKLTQVDGGNGVLYFAAPSSFLGNKRFSYMLTLSFAMTQENASLPLSSTAGDVILKSSLTNYDAVTTLPFPPSVKPQFRQYEVTFYEQNWRKNSTTGPTLTDDEMVAVLSSLSALWIRARWSQVSGQFFGLANVKLQYSSVNGSGTEMSNVERCFCPRSLYTGQFCESCGPGYTREIPGGDSRLPCVACHCHGHSTTCDPQNGICSNCQHFTTGNHCERCSQGFYGNATQGTSSDCSPCRCPGGPFSQNQFSKTCEIAADGRTNCTQCETGYEGRNCERCSDGYFGNPVSENGTCHVCTCNGNIDRSVAGNCNAVTGECHQCLYNTTGFSCQWCKEGFFGNALTRSCTGCQCNVFGSAGSLCNNVTGQCTCKTNVIGLSCDTCANNTYNIASGSGCELCNCNMAGSLSMQCNPLTGKCECKPNVLGDKCDRCAPGYYDVSRGCIPCNCNTSFTVANTSCDGVTGQCVCQQSIQGGPYGGRTCNRCGPNAIGAPPDCALCHYPCYDNWQQYIAREEQLLLGITRNASTLLAQFQGLTYQDVLLQIDHMNGNLSYASRVFEGAQFDTKDKESQLNQIETVIIQYEASLNRSETVLNAAQNFFASAASQFNGTVALNSVPPNPLPYPYQNVRVRRAITPISGDISPEGLHTLALEYVQASQTNNASGLVFYSTIRQSFDQILTINKSISDLASEVTASLSRLTEAAQARSKANNYLDQAFRSQLQANGEDLNRINTLLVSLETMLNQSELTQATAVRHLHSAQSVVAEAETRANLLKTSATANSRLASQMYISASALKTDAEAQQQAASNLKVSAETVQYDVGLANQAVVNSINQAASVRNQTLLAMHFSGQVLNTSMPVPLSRIQSLSNQILATSVDESQINETLAGAESGLRKAREVERLSQEAVNASQSALDDIRFIESALTNTTLLQNETRSIIADNDRKIKDVFNITFKVEQQMSSLKTAPTLQLLNSTIAEIERNARCFTEAKIAVDNATSIGQVAQNFTTEAAIIHQTNSATLLQYEPQINALFAASQQQFQEVKAVNESSAQLLHDVSEAEVLLAQFVQQKAELDQLKNQTAALETELELLVQQYNEAEAKFKNCNRN